MPWAAWPLVPRAKMRFMPARVGRNRLVGFRRVGEGRIPSMLRMALRDPATSRDASACRNRMKPIPTDHAPAGDIPIAFRFSVCPGKGGRRFSIAHPSIPSRWEGKKYRLSNDLFPLPTGGGCSSTDILFAMGISSVSRPSSARSMVLLGLCACLRPAGTGCEPAPSCRHELPACRTQGRDAALTIPGTGFSPIHAPRHDQPKITESAVGPLGGVPAGEAHALRDAIDAPAVREALTEIAPQRLHGAQGRDRRGLGAQDPRAEP